MSRKGCKGFFPKDLSWGAYPEPAAHRSLRSFFAFIVSEERPKEVMSGPWRSPSWQPLGARCGKTSISRRA
jgi:hypothetical protein